MDMKILFKIVLLSIFVAVVSSEYEYSNVTVAELEDKNCPSKVLSRRKRFLVFPDGSSLQLVFCTQNFGYLQLSNTIWFGNTAALAWVLPSDPQFLYMLKGHEKGFAAQRRQDVKHIYYLDEHGKIIDKVPYKRKPIVNPAFAKRSLDNIQMMVNSKLDTASIKKMHESQNLKKIFHDLNKESIDFHRNGRRSLYVKLETFLEGLGWRGRECVLRILCEYGKQKKKEQGTFLEEIVKAAFTLPQGNAFETERHKEYDIAHGTDEDCAKLYSECVDQNGYSLY